MIYLETYSGTTVALTLKEKATITNPYYYMNIINSQTKVETLLSLTDTSTYPNRYNLFNIVLSNSAQTGFYDYYCYEYATSGLTSVTGLTSIEQGKLLYRPDDETTNRITYKPTEPDRIVYNG